ncbi:MAG: beta-galactosidase [Clostridia bacterium]|nr:beta-galactosidase [Clostridia bacterium]
MSNIPRIEYPRPQFVRESYINLNGEWDFEFDFGVSGKARKMYEPDAQFTKKIIVPFCPESELSGIGYKDFMNAVWYRRKVELTKGEGRTLLHFEACDYETTVWVNGVEFPKHIGGYTGFVLDITKAVTDGENLIVVNAVDRLLPGTQPRGKQSEEYFSHGCDYTRTTGIWQTVWIEQVADTYISNSKIRTADLSGIINCDIYIAGDISDTEVQLTAYYDGEEVGTAVADVMCNTVNLSMALNEAHLWEVGNGRLYDLKYELIKGGEVIDTAKGYFGLRTVSLNKNAICINGKVVFQRLVLDQGFYPDGIYTAPTDEALVKDIELSLAAGFNGARLHQKVFEQRFLYHCDRLGYIVWGEYGNWGTNHTEGYSLGQFAPQWLEEIDRDYSHPSIVGWCPFNETWDMNGRQQCDDVLKNIYLITKAADNTRPCIDTSGNYHVMTDIYDIHEYEQDVEKFTAMMAENDLAAGKIHEPHPHRQSYGGQPYFVSEYGGAWWAPGEAGWGYGETPKTEEEAVERICGLTKAILDCDQCCAYCYTQLTNIEQEQNGIYYYDRTMKFSEENFAKIRAAFAAPAAIEN